MFSIRSLTVMALASGNAELEISGARMERFYVKLAFSAFLAIILLIALTWGGRKFYVRWEEHQLIHRAIHALSTGDAATASLALSAVLDLKPSSALAAR